MFGLVISMAFQISAQSGPVDDALRATEAPETFRAAFTVRLKSDKAVRAFHYDPRLEPAKRWKLTEASGEDDDLDEVVASWASEPAPDGRLFPDDLRPSLGTRVEVSNLGAAWRVAFRHLPSLNDSDLDIWFAEQVDAEAWLDPEIGRFLRLDYDLKRPVRGPDGGRLTAFAQTYLLECEPEWGLSYISSYTMSLEAKGGFRTVRRDYTATITSIDFFFSSPEAEAEFVAAQQRATGPSLASR